MSTDRLAALIRFAGAALRADPDAWPREAQSFAERHGAALAREVLRTLTLFAGIPPVLRALDLAAATLAARGAGSSPPADGERTALGAAAFARVYGPDAPVVLARLEDLDPELRDWVLEHAYGRGYQDTLLALEERERFAVIALAASGCWKQCESHLRACRRLGVSVAQLSADADAPGWLDDSARARLRARLAEGK
jgi:hypothetical protein